MAETGVKPEEPLFYIGLLMVGCYFLYLFYLDKRLKAKNRLKAHTLKNSILEAEKKLEQNTSLLKAELSQHYDSQWIDMALQGYLFEEMPKVLLQVAKGAPHDIQFTGDHGQVWQYGSHQGPRLLVNLWNDYVTSWHKIK